MKFIDEFKKMTSKEKCTCIVKYGSLCAFLICSLVLIIESLMPGSVSSKHSSAVGNLIDAPIDKVVPAVKVEISGIGELPSDVYVGQSLTLVPTFEPQNTTYKQVEWETKGGAKVNNDIVTFTKEGLATVTVRNAYDKQVSDTIEFNVKKVAASGIELSCPKTLTVGESAIIYATITPENATYRNYSLTSDSDCITINGTVIKGVKDGIARISAIADDDSSIIDTVEIVITYVPVQKIAFLYGDEEINEINLLNGESADLTISILPEHATFKDIAIEVTGDVNFRFKSLTSFTISPISNEATISVSCKNSTQVAVLTVHSNKPSKEITDFSIENLTMQLSECRSIETLNVNGKLSYELIEGENIISLNELGAIRALNKGEAKVKVTCGEFSHIATVTVTDLTIKSLSLKGGEYLVGKDYKLSYKFSPLEATSKEIVWSVDDKSVASITPNGIIQFIKAGSVVVTATANGGATSSIEISARNKLGLKTLKAYGFESFDGFTVGSKAEIKLNSSVQLSASYDSSATYRALTLSSSDPDVLLIKGNTVTALELGTATLTVTYWDGDEQNEITTYSVEVTVLKQMMSDFVGNWGLRVRKGIGHFGAFLLTGICCSVAFMMLFRRKYLGALLVPIAGFSLAGLTELLQMITPNRGPSFSDVLLDFEGFCIAAVPIVIGFLIFALIRFIKGKRDKSHHDRTA